MFEIVCFYFEAAVAKTFNKYNEISPKKALETLNLFYQFKFSEKKEVLPNLEWSRGVTGKINMIQSPFFPGRAG